GGERLALVERLGADLAGVVDEHQSGDVALALLVQFDLRLQQRRRGARGRAAEGQQGAQGGIHLQEQAIGGGIVTFAGHEFLRVIERRSVLHRRLGYLIPVSTRSAGGTGSPASAGQNGLITARMTMLTRNSTGTSLNQR